jgi:hypothetical protein
MDVQTPSIVRAYVRDNRKKENAMMTFATAAGAYYLLNISYIPNTRYNTRVKARFRVL